MDTGNTPSLYALLEGELYSLNRAGFTGQIAPLMRQHDGHAQVMVWTSPEKLESFRSRLNIETEVVRMSPENWRERAEFLEAVAAQGGFELIFDQEYAFRTGQALIEVEMQKTLTACL